jgi:3-hydroxybutyryl-CoA dehydratase
VTVAVGSRATFDVQVGADAMKEFAAWSGDWNPLHTDAEFASNSRFGRPVLHGAYSAGLISRLAGMFLPGEECLLHSMQLRFVAPVQPPASLRVTGEVIALASDVGRVAATVTDAASGFRYVDASYEFAVQSAAVAAPRARSTARPSADGEVVFVTGASGGLGAAVMQALGGNAHPLARESHDGATSIASLDDPDALSGRRIRAIVHCGWPAPDNSALTRLEDPETAVDHFLARPTTQIIRLARALARHGADDALLLLVGSTAAEPGRHAYKAPLYSLGKSLIPELTRVLAMELSGSRTRCAAIVFDVIEAGMNAQLSPRARLAHVDRSPHGRIPSAADAAGQVAWLLGNSSFLVSGATLTLTGAALP